MPPVVRSEDWLLIVGNGLIVEPRRPCVGAAAAGALKPTVVPVCGCCGGAPKIPTDKTVITRCCGGLA